MVSIPIHVAPMMKVTNAPFRHLCRLLNRNAVLYTEMIIDRCLALGVNPQHHLRRSPLDSPIVVQLGGRALEHLSAAAEQCQQAGFDEININMGCPSNAVQSGGFGAAMMLDENVFDIVKSLQQTVDIPVSVKCRIGVDNHDSPEFLFDFLQKMHSTGVSKFTIHARKALLGKNPKENRSIPPLNYDIVYRIKREMPNLHIILNGGIKDLSNVQNHIGKVDAVMIGRAIRDNPFLLHQCQNGESFSGWEQRMQIARLYANYAEEELGKGFYPIRALLNPLMNLFASTPVSSLWKRNLQIGKNESPSPIKIVGSATDKVYEILSQSQHHSQRISVDTAVLT